MMSVQAVSVSLFIILIMKVEFIQNIYNGDKVQFADDYEHHVLLWKNGDVKDPCGGSIIDKWHILTAAHCLDILMEQEVYVTAGIIRTRDANNAITRKVRDIRIASDWCYELMDPSGIGDIALVKLETPLVLGPGVRAIHLPQKEEIDYAKIHEFYGWGKISDESRAPPKNMYKMDFKVLTPAECTNRSAPHSEKGLCAISSTGESTVLGGDSGGGLILEDTIVGVLSNSAEDPEVPSRFMKVSSYLDFINGVLNEDRGVPSSP